LQWRKWGLFVEDDIHLDINYAPLTLDEKFIERSERLLENVFLPSLEDIIVLKLMSGERKDIEDVKKILHQAWHAINKEYLRRRARETGLERSLEKLLRRLGLQ